MVASDRRVQKDPKVTKYNKMWSNSFCRHTFMAPWFLASIATPPAPYRSLTGQTSPGDSCEGRAGSQTKYHSLMLPWVRGGEQQYLCLKLAVKMLNWLFVHKPFQAPNRPKPPQTLNCPENPASSRDFSGLLTEFILSAILNSTEFPWIFSECLEVSPKFHRTPWNFWEIRGGEEFTQSASWKGAGETF